MWAVAFYHEDAVAPEVVEMVNDIPWLHRPYYTPDGAYKEGVIQYSVMSITGLIQSAVVQRASFGAAPMAIDVTALERVVAYMLASMPTDGYAVDFGDSHAKRGWGGTHPLQAAMAARIVSGTSLSDADAAIDGCKIRSFSANMYGSGGFYDDPWELPSELLELQLSARAQNCSSSHSRAQPLGGATTTLFPTGGYAAMRLPTLRVADGEGSSGAPPPPPPCFGIGAAERCIDASKPSLFDNVPYASVTPAGAPKHVEPQRGGLRDAHMVRMGQSLASRLWLRQRLPRRSGRGTPDGTSTSITTRRATTRSSSERRLATRVALLAATPTAMVGLAPATPPTSTFLR